MQKKFIRSSLIPLILAFVLAFFNIIPYLTVSAEEIIDYEGSQGEIYKLNNEDMTAYLYKAPTGKIIEKFVIPEKINVNGKMYTVNKINSKAYYCSIQNIVIPKTVNKIEIDPSQDKNMNFFYFWNALENITVDSDNNTFCSLDGVLYNKSKTELLCYPKCKKEKDFKIPDSVIKINANAFYNSKNLESITLPSGLKEIGIIAFVECINLKTINMTEENIEIVGAFAFSNTLWEANQPSDIYIGTIAYKCRSLNGKTEYYFREDTTFISTGFFSDISEAEMKECKKITIPKSIKNIDHDLFAFFSGLETISVDKDNESFVADENGILFSKDKKVLVFYPQGKKDTSYTVPESVEVIAENAFLNSKISEVSLPKSLKKISDSAFQQSNIKNIKIPGSVTEMGQSAFGCCESLENIYICEGVTAILNRSFGGCTNLKNIVIPTSVHAIESNIFDKSISLMSRKGSYTERYCVLHDFKFDDYVEKLNNYVKEITSEEKDIYSSYDLMMLYNLLDDDEKKLITDGEKIALIYERSLYTTSHPSYRGSFYNRQIYIKSKIGVLPKDIAPSVVIKDLTEEQQKTISEKIQRLITPISGFELNLVTKSGEQAEASNKFGSTEVAYKFRDNTEGPQDSERALIFIDSAGNIAELPFSINEDGEAIFDIKGSGIYAFIYKGAKIKGNNINYGFVALGVAAFALPTAIYIIIKGKKEQLKKKQTA